MRRRRTNLIASIVACAAPRVIAAAAQAASYPVDPLTFKSDQLTFPSGVVTFPTDTLSFPSGPVRTETATTIEVTVPADVLFDFDRADIRPSARDALQEVAQLLRERARGRVAIQGYTDALGSDSYNQQLSERRAAAVKMWLRANEGLATMPFTTTGFGARNPVAPNRKADGSDDPGGRQRNRRVTFIING